MVNTYFLVLNKTMICIYKVQRNIINLIQNKSLKTYFLNNSHFKLTKLPRNYYPSMLKIIFLTNDIFFRPPSRFRAGCGLDWIKTSNEDRTNAQLAQVSQNNNKPLIKVKRPSRPTMRPIFVPSGIDSICIFVRTMCF